MSLRNNRGFVGDTKSFQTDVLPLVFCYLSTSRYVGNMIRCKNGSLTVRSNVEEVLENGKDNTVTMYKNVEGLSLRLATHDFKVLYISF